MDADVPWPRLKTDMLLTNDISHVGEYLWALQNQSPVVPLSPDATKADCGSLWPESLYPDLYGKLLDQERMAQSVYLHSARDYPFPTVSAPPGEAVGQLCFSAPATGPEFSERSCSSSGCWADYAATDPAHRQGSPVANEYALLGEPELEPLFAVPGELDASPEDESNEITNTRARDDQRANTASANLKTRNVEEDGPMQNAEVTGRKMPRRQGKGRISHLRAEDEIASLSRASRTAIAIGWSRTNGRRKCRKARKRSRPALPSKA